MRILVKIVLTVVVLIVAVMSQAMVYENGNTNTAMVRLIPGIIAVFGIIGVWKYKPKKQSEIEKTELDKTL